MDIKGVRWAEVLRPETRERVSEAMARGDVWILTESDPVLPMMPEVPRAFLVPVRGGSADPGEELEELWEAAGDRAEDLGSPLPVSTPGKVSVLFAYRKWGDQDEVPIVASRDRGALVELARVLDAAIGYRAGLGLWGQRAPGFFRVIDVDLREGNKLLEAEVYEKALKVMRGD